MRKIHTCKELCGLPENRKTSADIRKTIKAQARRARGNKRKEEFLTRRLRERGYLLNENEHIIFDQYPLSRGNRTRIDIVYVYKDERSKKWKLGIVEAKIDGKLQDAVDQAKDYKNQLRGDNKKVLSTMARCKYNLKFSRHLTVGRIDILGTQNFWEENKKNRNAYKCPKGIEIRRLSVNNDYLEMKNKIKI